MTGAEVEEGAGDEQFDPRKLGISLLATAIIWLYKITSLGIVFHEFAHQLLVEWRGYRVHEVDYFSHVTHDMPRSIIDALLIAYAPLIVNTMVSGTILFLTFGSLPVSGSVLTFSSLKMLGVELVALFIVFSLLFHSIPSLEDIQNIVNLVKDEMEWYRIDLAILFLPFLPLFLPVYFGLLLSRKTHTRVVVDLGFVIFAVVSFFGIWEWWIPLFGLLQGFAEMILQKLVEIN